MQILTLSIASQLVDSAIEEARKRDFAPLTVAVLDSGGHLVAFKREDGSGIARYELAFGKAWGSLGMGFGSRELAKRSAALPTFFGALPTITDGRMVPSPGGVLILNDEKQIIGAIGISGDVGDNDEQCAVVAIEKAKLSPAVGAID